MQRQKALRRSSAKVCAFFALNTDRAASFGKSDFNLDSVSWEFHPYDRQGGEFPTSREEGILKSKSINRCGVAQNAREK